MRRKSSESWPRTRYVLKDNEAIAKHFPAPNVTLLSPAFLWPETIPPGFKEGTAAPTDEATLDLFLSLLADRNHWMVYNPSDFQSEDGRDIPYLLLSSSSLDLDLDVDVDLGLNASEPPQKLRVWIQGSTHGDEPASEQAVLAFLGKLDSDPRWTASLLAKLEILIVPRYNADGAFYASRRFASDIDPARDNISQVSSQTTSIKALYNSFSPHVSVDMHEFGARYRYAGGQYVQGVDGQIAVGKNLNISHEIRHLSETMFMAGLGTALTAANLRWQPYAVGNSYEGRDTPLEFVEAGGDARITRNAWGLTQSIAFLCESRGIGIADQHFARRTYTGLLMLSSIVDTSAVNVLEILTTLQRARRDFIDGDADVVVTDTRTILKMTTAEAAGAVAQRRASNGADASHSHPRPQPRPFIHTTTGALVNLDVRLLSSNPLIPVVTRRRPKAYIIPPSPAQELIVSKLNSLGLDLSFASESKEIRGREQEQKQKQKQEEGQDQGEQQDSLYHKGNTNTTTPVLVPVSVSVPVSTSIPIPIPKTTTLPVQDGHVNDRVSPSSSSSLSSPPPRPPPRRLRRCQEMTKNPRTTRARTRTIPQDAELTIPRGSFILDTRQKNAGLAFMALETESEASFVASGILDAVIMEVEDGVVVEEEEEEEGEGEERRSGGGSGPRVGDEHGGGDGGGSCGDGGEGAGPRGMGIEELKGEDLKKKEEWEWQWQWEWGLVWRVMHVME